MNDPNQTPAGDRRPLKLATCPADDLLDWIDAIAELEPARWCELPRISMHVELPGRRIVRISGGRGLANWHGGAHRRHLMLIFDRGQASVERVDPARKTVVADLVAPGCFTTDGRPLDLVGLVRHGIEWLRTGEAWRQL